MKRYLYGLATDQTKGILAALIKFFLWILSSFYGLIVRLLILLKQRDSHHLGCKVISIGNITVGGTGKTALVEFIAGYLKDQGHQIAILSRGYKREIQNPCLPDSQAESRTQNYETMGDEPYMLKMRLKDIPVIVDKDRVRAALRAVEIFHVDTVILDDAFQQWKIARDLNVVTVDATRPFGNRQLLPRGILREPLTSLKRADIFVLTKTNLSKDTTLIKEELNRLNPDSAVFESSHEAVGFYDANDSQHLLSPDSLRSKTVTLFSGIGDPDSFENLIKTMGIRIGLSCRFGDHHLYSKQDLDGIFKASRDKQIETLITTEKDIVRIDPLKLETDGLRVLALRISLTFKDEQGFCHRLLKLYSV
ncbi:MAG: tetraacyldisaccharide 4'-kinase [Candidatus Omnitrophota bacterium]